MHQSKRVRTLAFGLFALYFLGVEPINSLLAVLAGRLVLGIIAACLAVLTYRNLI